MNLVRKIKISKISNKPLIGIDKEIVDFIESILSDLIPFHMDNEPTSFYYMKLNGDWILDQDNNSDRLWVRYEDFWEVLETKYFIDYKDIQNIIKYFVEQVFKQKISIAIENGLNANLQVENAFKQKVSTPLWRRESSNFLAEQAFKQKVSTPDYENIKYVRYVEEAFKKTYFNQ